MESLHLHVIPYSFHFILMIIIPFIIGGYLFIPYLSKMMMMRKEKSI